MNDYKKLVAEGSNKANSEKAKKLLGDQGSSSCGDENKIRFYKKGGSVKKTCK